MQPHEETVHVWKRMEDVHVSGGGFDYYSAVCPKGQNNMSGFQQ